MIQDMIDTCWRYNKEDLANYLAKRVIYEDDSLIAFDKPYFLAYSGKSKEKELHMDSCLQELKKIVSPGIDRLNLIKSLDKQYSGIILFGKNIDDQKRYKELLNDGLCTFTYKVLVRGIPLEKEATINFPLVKILRNNGDMVVKPLREDKNIKNRNNIFFASTHYRVIESNKSANMSYLHITINKEYPHQIRSHLSYGINTPLIGDYKYNPLNTKNISLPPKFNSEATNLLNIESKNGYKKIPMICHLGKLTFPGSKADKTPLSIKATMPVYMNYILRKLLLLKK
uniref:Pseudouridylate synthase RPUSD4, mitochondrial n=1 Tax=Parastrongyloides trichosuri TaxID=131310 RepID=A0A0N5A268_PARTI